MFDACTQMEKHRENIGMQELVKAQNLALPNTAVNPPEHMSSMCMDQAFPSHHACVCPGMAPEPHRTSNNTHISSRVWQLQKACTKAHMWVPPNALLQVVMECADVIIRGIKG
jgi:hypothetical protein